MFPYSFHSQTSEPHVMTHLLYITPVYISMLVRSLRSDPLEKDPGNVTEVRAGDVFVGADRAQSDEGSVHS